MYLALRHLAITLIILCTSGMSVYTKEICNQELIYGVTKSFLNASYNVYIAFCPQHGYKKLDDSKKFQFQKGEIGIK